MRKKILVKMLAVAGAAAVMMAGCGNSEVKDTEASNSNVEEETSDMEEDEENYETGDASLDNVRNQDEIGENELLVISFGTSYNDSRRLTIGAIEDALEAKFGENYAVRRGFTSQIIIDHVKKRDNVTIDNVKEALDRAVDNGVRKLVIQPTHLMNGLEYKDVVDEVAGYADQMNIAIGEPLLTSEADYDAVVKAITEATAKYDDGKTAICFMGHGTEAESNAVYAKMQQKLKDAGYANYFVGTVEADPTVDDVLALVKAGNYEKVVLRPLMIVAGDHANNDMAGDEEDSWKSIFKEAGYEVECVVEGLGQLEAIQQLFVEHAQTAMDSLNQ